MPNHFFTNHGPQTLLAKFEGVFSSNKDLAGKDNAKRSDTKSKELPIEENIKKPRP
jgi:hypothetical protein